MAALKAVEVYAHATLLDHPAIWLRNLTSRLIVACVAALASVLTAVCQGFMLREPQFVASSNAASAIQYAFSAAFASVICVMTTSMPVVTSPSLRVCAPTNTSSTSSSSTITTITTNNRKTGTSSARQALPRRSKRTRPQGRGARPA